MEDMIEDIHIVTNQLLNANRYDKELTRKLERLQDELLNRLNLINIKRSSS